MAHKHGENEEQKELSPELLDIVEHIRRFQASNKSKVAFLFAFMGFKEVDEACEECGNHEEPDNSKCITGGFGDLTTLRVLSENLRDELEDNCNRQGEVSF